MAGVVKRHRGEIWTANLNPGFGVEIHKTRPVLIVSNDQFNQILRTTIIVPLSSQINPLGPEKVLIEHRYSGLDRNSAVLTPLIRAIDSKRLINRIGKISAEKMAEVEDAIKLILGMIPLD